MAKFVLLVAIIGAVALILLAEPSNASLSQFIRGRRFLNKENALKLNSKEFNGITFPPEQYFEQQLDHFNPTNNATWLQVSNDEPSVMIFLLENLNIKLI